MIQSQHSQTARHTLAETVVLAKARNCSTAAGA